MIETTTVVRIDRSTFRRNPDAGKTGYWHPHGKYVEFTRREGGVVSEWRSLGEVKDVDGHLVGQAFCTEAKGDARAKLPALVGDPEPFSLRIGTDFFRVQNPGEWVHTERPAADWLFDYLPADFFVECRHCGAQFKATKLETVDYVDGDGDDRTAYDRCPTCHEEDAVELAYEKPEDVAREMGLAKA